MILGDGITRITDSHPPAYASASVRTAAAPSNRLSFEEMRMAALLQKVRHLDGTRLPAEEAFAMGTTGGAALLGIAAGDIAPGARGPRRRGLAHPSLHPHESEECRLHAMSPQAVTKRMGAWRAVVRAQKLATLEQEALMERVRRLTHGWVPA
jgi:5-methylthioadenosine/S-adenosylhomocysteine deaminase